MRTVRLTWLCVAILAAVQAAPLADAAPDAERRPNIVFLFADD
jgi:hypothetical protein